MKPTKTSFAETMQKICTFLVLVLLGITIQYIYGLWHRNGILMISLLSGLSVGALAGTYIFDTDKNKNRL